MEDQAVHVVGDVGERQFRLRTGQADRADEEAETGLLVGEDMLDGGPDGRLLALACAVALGIGLPAGLRRWIRLTSIRSASHLSFFRDL